MVRNILPELPEDDHLEAPHLALFIIRRCLKATRCDDVTGLKQIDDGEEDEEEEEEEANSNNQQYHRVYALNYAF